MIFILFSTLTKAFSLGQLKVDFDDFKKGDSKGMVNDNS